MPNRQPSCCARCRGLHISQLTLSPVRGSRSLPGPAAQDLEKCRNLHCTHVLAHLDGSRWSFACSLNGSAAEGVARTTAVEDPCFLACFLCLGQFSSFGWRLLSLPEIFVLGAASVSACLNSFYGSELPLEQHCDWRNFSLASGQV